MDWRLCDFWRVFFRCGRFLFISRPRDDDRLDEEDMYSVSDLLVVLSACEDAIEE